jgi:hypothetical protein
MAFAASALGAGSSILSGITGGKAAKEAAKTQAAAYQKGIDEQHRQFDVTQANFQPYQQAGTQGLSGIMGLLGLNGNDTQEQAIASLKASPAFTSLYNTGQDTILQNAAATGGLRGGNTESSLANYGSGLLSQVIQQQLAGYGGLASTGVGATNSLAGFGQQTSNNVSNLLGQQGQASASGTLGQAAALQGIFKSLASFGSQAGGLNPNTGKANGIGW